MTEKKQELPEVTRDVMIADALLRLAALETLLLQKGVFTKAELETVTEEIAQQISKAVLSKLEMSKSLSEFIEALEGKQKAVKN